MSLPCLTLPSFLKVLGWQNNLKVHGQKRRCNPNPETPVRVASGFHKVSEFVAMANHLIQYWISLWNSSVLRETHHKTPQYPCLIWIGFELLFKFYLFLFVLCLHVVCTWQCLRWSEDSVRSPESEVIDSYELSCGCWESSPRLLEVQPRLLTGEPSLQLAFNYF